MLEFGLFLLALAAPEIPKDAERCMAEKKLWLAGPRFVEAIELGDPSPRRAYQIHDQLEGADGHILVYPDTCRVVVLVLQPAPTGSPLERAFFVSAPPGSPATKQEIELLRRWLGLRSFPEEDPRMGLAQTARVTWQSGAMRGDDFVLQQQHRRVNLAWGRAESGALSRVALPTTNAAIETLLLMDALAPAPEGSVVKTQPRGLELSAYSAPGTTALALRLIDGERSAWAGLFDVGEFGLEAHHAGEWSWVLTGTHTAPVLIAVSTKSGAQHRLVLRTGEARVRVALTPRGLSVGRLDRPSTTVDWASLESHLSQ